MMIEHLLQFGVAGLMGVLWVWERTHSRRREQQLTAAHHRLMRRDEQVRLLMRLTQKNTRALVEFERTQRRLAEIMEGVGHAMWRQHHHSDR